MGRTGGGKKGREGREVQERGRVTSKKDADPAVTDGWAAQEVTSGAAWFWLGFSSKTTKQKKHLFFVDHYQPDDTRLEKLKKKDADRGCVAALVLLGVRS